MKGLVHEYINSSFLLKPPLIVVKAGFCFDYDHSQIKMLTTVEPLLMATFHHDHLSTTAFFFVPADGPCIRELSNDHSNGSEYVKKAIGLISKTTTLHVQHTFLYISLPSLHDYGVKIPNFTF